MIISRCEKVDPGTRLLTLNLEEAVELSLELIKVLNEKSFKLTKWISNSTEVLLQLPRTEVKTVSMDLDELPMDRALGMRWDPNKDVFTFNVMERVYPDTKRGMLSLIS